jgi:hypothetical protein
MIINKAEPERFTLADLICVVRQSDPQSTDKDDSTIGRRIADWIERGLIDKADLQSKGYKDGVHGTWSRNQLELLAVVVRKRQEVEHIAALCNLPVGVWLYWGEDHVPLRQVRRALKTWSKRAYLSEPSSKEAARSVLRDIDSPGASPADRKQFVKEISRSLHKGVFNDDTLLPLMWRIYDPAGKGIVRTRGGVEMTPDALLRFLKMRTWVTRTLDEVPDTVFHWARTTNLMTRATYRAHTVALHGEDFFQKTDSAFNPQAMYGDACQDVMGLLWQASTIATKTDRRLDNPKIWKKENLTSTIQTALEPGGYRIRADVSKAADPD